LKERLIKMEEKTINELFGLLKEIVLIINGGNK
jgi:hypothetical protein